MQLKAFEEMLYLQTRKSNLFTKKLDLLFLRSGSWIKFLLVNLVSVKEAYQALL